MPETSLHDVVEVVVRRDDESWTAWSPQCPGLMIIEPTSEDLQTTLKPALRFFFETTEGTAPRRLIMASLEQKVNDIVIRVRHDDFVYERELLSQRLVAASTQETSEGRSIRSAPIGLLGEIVYICSLPADTLGMLIHQIEEGDTVNIVLPATENFLWTTVVSRAGKLPKNSEAVSTADLGFDENTTLGEVMTRCTPKAKKLILI